MKILHLNDHLSWSGGIETYMLSLIARLEALGHPQIVGFSSGDEHLARSCRMPWLSKSDRRSERDGYQQTARFLATEQPDVVHLHNIYNVGAIAACLDNVPTVVHGHDYRYLCPASTFYYRKSETVCDRVCGPACYGVTLRSHCMSLRPPYAWTYYRRVRFVAENSGRFAHVVAPSGYVKDRYCAAGFEAQRISVLPYFCPIEMPAAPRQVPLQPTILFIGRVRPNKGFRYFVEALGGLPENIRGIMVGDFSGDVAAEIGNIARRAGCDARLELRPWASRDEIHQVYSAATLLIFPSTWAETLGIVGLEALACGVPVVASDIGGVREWLVDGETGRLVPPKNSAAIARAVVEIVGRPDQGQALGDAGRQLIGEKFLPEQHIDRLLACYEVSCLSASARAVC